jgi:hypothetical protein
MYCRSDLRLDTPKSTTRTLSEPLPTLELGASSSYPLCVHLVLTRSCSVPICLAGARLTVDQILVDRKMPNPWREREAALEAAEQKAQIKVLDRVNTTGMETAMWISFFAAFLALLVGMVPVLAGFAVQLK